MERSIDRDQMIQKRKAKRRVLAFIVVLLLLIAVFFASVNIGSIKVSFSELIRGLFIEYDADVSSIFDLRFPRIIIAVLAGAGVSVSGVLFQAVLKNPLADPGIIGISSAAAFVAVVVTCVVPQLFFLMPIFACLGGLIAFALVYTLSWKGGLSPLRIILVGVAVNALFTGLSSALNSFSGGNLQGVAAIVNGNISMKTWDDVATLFPYTLAGLLLACLVCGTCNLFGLEDRTAKSLGVNVSARRLWVSVIACILACISTAVTGPISFLGLIVPHMGRLLVGSDHKVLIPFSMLLGAFVFLLADTVGRTIAAPYEIAASVIMSVVGGPAFIILLRRSKTYGK